jgi:hypothetical protein
MKGICGWLEKNKSSLDTMSVKMDGLARQEEED